MLLLVPLVALAMWLLRNSLAKALLAIWLVLRLVLQHSAVYAQAGLEKLRS